MRKVAIVGAIGVFALTACAREEAPQVAQEGPLEIVATDYGFEGAPEAFVGGAVEVTFTNEGDAQHELAFSQIGDTTPAELGADIAKLDEGGPFPDYLTSGAVPFQLEPGESQSTTFTLPEGEWTLYCALTDAPGEGDREVEPHTTLGMFQKVTVEAGEGELEADGGEFVARDYTFDVPADISPGKNTFAFTNGSEEQFHHLLIQEFPEGVTADQATDAFGKLLQAGEDEPPPPGVPTPAERPVAATGIYSAGLGQTFDADLKAGRTYVAVCFISDRDGGPPHAIEHKMYKAFTVVG